MPTQESRQPSDLKRLARAFDASVMSILVVDLTGTVVHANAQFLKAAGYTAAEAAGKPFSAFCMPNDAPKADDAIQHLRDGKGRQVDLALRQKDGRPMAAAFCLTPLRDSSQAAIGALAIVRGGTPADPEARFRSIFENSRDALFLADAESGRIIDANEAACALLGRPKEQVIGMHQSEIHEPEKAAFYKELFRRHLEEGRAFDHDLYVKTKSGKRVPVDIAANVVEIAGRQIIQGAFRDVTERKGLQAELIRSERMSAIGQLASGIAHEFNNLHCAVQGHLELALQNKDLPAKVRRQLDMANRASRRATSITRQLLAFSRQREMQKQPRNLAEVVEETLRLVAHEFESEGIEITVRQEAMPDIVIDPVQIGQVVMNLLINARHAMVASSEKRLAIETGARGNRACIRIADSGCGIPPEHMDRIFEPFFTTKGAASDGNIPGAGLGLAVCDTIVKDHQGEIEVSSEPGRGSVFTVWLGMNLPPATEPAAKTKPPGRLDGLRVLVIDDEEIIRNLVIEALEPMHCLVHATRSGREGARMAATGDYDVVLVDLQMPDLPGEHVLEQINKMPSSTRPAKLVITGKANVQNTADFDRYGVSDFLFKPFTIDDLCTAIADAAKHRKETRQP